MLLRFLYFSTHEPHISHCKNYCCSLSPPKPNMHWHQEGHKILKPAQPCLLLPPHHSVQPATSRGAGCQHPGLRSALHSPSPSKLPTLTESCWRLLYEEDSMGKQREERGLSHPEELDPVSTTRVAGKRPFLATLEMTVIRSPRLQLSHPSLAGPQKL